MATKKTVEYKALLKMAKEWQVDKNALFCAAAAQYETQQQCIAAVREIIESGQLIVKKSYVKGEENVYANPLVQNLPKHCDAANKTAATMLNIIKTLGKEPQKKDSAIAQFNKAFED